MTIGHGVRGIVRLGTAADDEAIHRLNHRTFALEIPQHPANADGLLPDRFHGENTYAVYEVDGAVVGMVAGRATRPFSLDTKLGGVDRYLPPDCTPVEFRLLAVERAFRSTRAFTALVSFLTRHFLDRGFDTAVISGTTRQLKLYEHLGFRAFGSLIGREGAWYQPMLITAADVARWPRSMRGTNPETNRDADSAVETPVNCLPGPVAMREAVHAAFRSAPTSHRSHEFQACYDATVERLLSLTRAKCATMLLGSGTLANDVVAAALVSIGAHGVVATNGEFGERLVDHARRAGLRVTVAASAWGNALDCDAIDRALASSKAAWLWVTHCETSSGVLNDIGRLRAIAAARGAALAVDAISSVGAVPVDLTGVQLASAVSGKALGAYPGLAVVFHDGAPIRRTDVPRYLDLAFAHEQHGVPFTHSSNLVCALHAAVDRTDWRARFARIAQVSAQMRAALADHGLEVLTRSDHASPAVLTVPLRGVSSRRVGDMLRAGGVLVSYESAYLLSRNWIQLCLMGEFSEPAMLDVPSLIARTVTRCTLSTAPSSRSSTRAMRRATSAAAASSSGDNAASPEMPPIEMCRR